MRKCKYCDSTLKLYKHIQSKNFKDCTLILNKKCFPKGFNYDMWEVFRKRNIEIKWRRRYFINFKCKDILRSE